MGRLNRTRAPSPEPSAPNTGPIPVIFLKFHTHAGVDYNKGDRASFSQEEVERMLAYEAISLDND